MRRLFVITAFLVFSLSYAKEANPSFASFTGKVTGSKVRLRADADLNSKIITQLDKNSLFLIVGEKKGFYAVRPPENTRFYVFRSYVIDDTVEAYRVNIRLYPSLDAPVVGRLEHKQKICGKVLPNGKWLAIEPPDNVHFYIAKDYIAKAGKADYYFAMQKKKGYASALAAQNTASSQNIREALNSDSDNLKKFSETIKKEPKKISDPGKERSGSKIAAADMSRQNKASFADLQKSKISSFPGHPAKRPIDPKFKRQLQQVQKVDLSQKMKKWLPAEAELFASWNTFHPDRDADDFYKEQLASCLEIEGTLERFSEDVQNKPGDYLIKIEDLPAAYLYSTQVNLEPYVNRKIKARVTPRPNNNFAFPAYFVLETD